MTVRSTITMRYPTAWHGDMWREGAPCGNGVVGALVYGGTGEERILLNHTKLWRGGKVADIPDVSAALADVRQKLADKRPDLADGIFQKALADSGYYAESTVPLPLCDICIRKGSVQSHTGYRRVVDMEKAEVRVSWRENDTLFTRSTFVSRADGLCYTRITAEGAGRIDADISLQIHDPESMQHPVIQHPMTEVRGDTIRYSAETYTVYDPAVGRFGAMMRVQTTGGTMVSLENAISVRGAEEVLLVTSVFVGMEEDSAFRESEELLKTLVSYDTALARHTAIHRPQFLTSSFSIASDSAEDTANEHLLLNAFDNGMSAELAEKMYAYGRYLFLCAVDPEKGMPVHLVGLWNGSYSCFWAIHMFNVNFEMIYWHTLSGSMPDYLRAALEYLEGYMEDFRCNAKNIYGCRGIYMDSVHMPESGKAACLANHIINWTAGAAWVSQHFYNYYRYTGDTEFLREHALPFMREAALFFEDFLTEGEDGRFWFAPSTSPENVPASTTELFGSQAQVSCNAAMDISVVRELLTNLLEGSALTGMYADNRNTWETMLTKLPDMQVNPDGSLKEWADPFYTDCTTHRHQSHLYGVFPGYEVREGHPLYDAYVKAEERRLTEGLYAQSSWSAVYMACTFARMGQGDKAWFALSEMVRHCCMNNLFTLHNDWRRMGSVGCDDFRVAPFQIDANIGFPAAVHEMLAGSDADTLTLFPALPSQWKEGKMDGLLVMGGHTLSLQWDETSAVCTLEKGFGQDMTICCGSGWQFCDGTTRKNLSAEDTQIFTLCRI